MVDLTSPILVLGASGTTGRKLVRELTGLGVPVRAASRHPDPATPGVSPIAFDWDDPATHDAVLAGVQAVYLLAPPSNPDPATPMIPFVHRAVDHGVRRLVLHSASAIERGDPHLGRVHAAVAESGSDWAAVRPSWFMQNLWNPHHPVGAAVRAGRDIVTATGSGRVAFVDAGDIARVAAAALTGRAGASGDLIVTGPEALSYDDVAAILSRALGRVVRHRGVGVAEATATMTAAGVPAPVAEMLAGLDAAIAEGAEDRTTDTVARVTGHAARSLESLLADDPFGQETA